jgi:AcrR family transcriptional regulator
MTGHVPRVRMSREGRRAQLIELGVDMLSNQTLDELSVDDIAAAAGISRGLLFHYFSSKSDFQLEVVRAAAGQLLEVTAVDESVPVSEELDVSIGSYVDYVTANQSSYISLVRGAASADPSMQAVFDETRLVLAERVVQRWTKFGGPEPGPLFEIAVRGWVAFTEEAVIVWLTDYNAAVSRDELLGLLRETLLRILKDQAARSGLG